MCFEGTAIGQWNYSADATSGHFSVPITNTQTCGGYDTLGGWAAAFGGSMTLSYVAG